MEGVTTSLASIWFTGGSLATLVVQVSGGGLYPQLTVFVAVFFMLFLMACPSAYKYPYSKRANANTDSLTGRRAVVKEHIDNVAGTGNTVLAGEAWLVRATQEGDISEAGDVVIISVINRAELLVATAKQEHEVEKVQRDIKRIHVFGAIRGPTTFIIIVVVTLFILSACTRIVPQAQALVVERLGVYFGTYSVGIHFLAPFIDRAAKKVDPKEWVEDFPPQPIIIRGNAAMQIDTVVFFYIANPKLYAYGVEHPLPAIENLTATTLQNIIGDLELDETLTSRETINAKMQESLDIATGPQGIKVTRAEFKNITPSAAIQEAMERQMKAEREHRESTLRAEGEEKPMILVAEGSKKSAILNAETEKEVAILRTGAEKEKKIKEAQGQAGVIRPVQKATTDGIRFIREAGADNAVPQFKSLEVFQAAANGKANKIIIPSDIQGIAGLVKSIAEVAVKDEAAE